MFGRKFVKFAAGVVLAASAAPLFPARSFASPLASFSYLSLNPAIALTGTTVQVSGSVRNQVANQLAVLRLDSLALKTFWIGQRGSIATSFVVPSTTAGVHTVSVVVGNTVQTQAALTVTLPAASAPAPTATSTSTPLPTRTPVPTQSPMSFPTQTPVPTQSPTSVATSTPVATATATPAPVPGTSASGVYLGVWQPGLPTDTSGLVTFEQQTGKKVGIAMFWRDWGSPDKSVLDTTWLHNIASMGSTPMITWCPANWAGGDQSPYSLSSIASGVQDNYIRGWAQQLKAYGSTVLLRFAHEMNGNWYSWGVQPQQYIAAWKHVHDIFTSTGATNVKWVWSPNTEDAWTPSSFLTQYYPGDNYVDWVALDGYNKGSSGYGWQTWSQMFSGSYTTITTLTSKPLMIAETSSNDATATQTTQGLSKTAWIADAFAYGIPSMPRIRAVVWFNEDKTAAEGCCNWTIQSSAGVQAAYAQAISAPMYLSSPLPL